MCAGGHLTTLSSDTLVVEQGFGKKGQASQGIVDAKGMNIQATRGQSRTLSSPCSVPILPQLKYRKKVQQEVRRSDPGQRAGRGGETNRCPGEPSPDHLT